MENLKQKLIAAGLSKTHAGDLASGRQTPSMKLARRLHTELGISPMVWLDLSERKEAAND